MKRENQYFYTNKAKMNHTTILAERVRRIYAGHNWSNTNLKNVLESINYTQANATENGTNSVLALAYHINYYINGIAEVLQGGDLVIRDKFSFDHPPIDNEKDWQAFVSQFLKDGEKFATLVEQLPEEQLSATFIDEKYGDFYKNLNAVIEHSYYHFGQIVLLTKHIVS